MIPGCISQGRTRDQALANVREAIELSLQTRQHEGWTLPSTYEIVEVTIVT